MTNSLHDPLVLSDSVSLYRGDCFDILPGLRDVGQVVTSPPFNAGMDYELTAWKTLAEFDEFTRAWVTACAAALRPGGWMCVEVQDMHVSPEHPHAAPGQKEQSCMGTHAKIVLALMDAGLLLKACAVWNRGRWSGNAARLTCAPGSPALLCHHSNLLFARKPGGRPGAYDFPELTNSEKAIWCRSVWDHVQPQAVNGHPCAMPEKMAAGMVMGWSLPPDTILDPFMGSGTVGLAAIRHGRRFVGIEQDAGYFDLARNRLERELAQGVLPFGHNVAVTGQQKPEKGKAS